jgi:hypothetical protein
MPRACTLAALFLAVVLTAPDSAVAAGPPTIPAAWVADVTSSSAVMWAEVNPEGSTTRYHFEYLTEAAYEANLAAGGDGFDGARAVPSSSGLGIGSGTALVPVSFTLTAPGNALTPATGYRFRVVAGNAAGAAASPAHLLRTRGAGAPPGLPDGRGWELVSPVDKGGGSIAAPGQLFGGGAIQAAAGGGALTYGSATAFADPVAAPPVSQYLSVRGAGGWSTENLSPPLESDGYGDHPDGAPFRVFSPDLARGVMLNGSRCALEGTCPPSYSLWSAGSFQLLPTVSGLRLDGAGPDLRHLVFSAEGALYEWSGAALEQIDAGPAVLAAPIGAVSEDGSRVYYSLLEDGPIYLHEAGAGARPVPETVGGSAEFQAASADGAVAYFTRSGQLFRFSADAGTSTPIATGVIGVLAVSRDGSRVYVQDGDGLEAWHEGEIRQVAAGADATLPSDYPPATASARLSADG